MCSDVKKAFPYVAFYTTKNISRRSNRGFPTYLKQVKTIVSLTILVGAAMLVDASVFLFAFRKEKVDDIPEGFN